MCPVAVRESIRSLQLVLSDWRIERQGDDEIEITQAALKRSYDGSGTDVMHLQAGIVPYDRFVRCVGLGPQTRVVNYDPAAPLHDRYTMQRDFLPPDEQRVLEDITLTINSFFGWDFNSCESLRKDGVFYPIDFANACPDSQVTSLQRTPPWAFR